MLNPLNILKVVYRLPAVTLPSVMWHMTEECIDVYLSVNYNWQ